MENKIQELFALPIGMKEIGNVDGINFYSSDELVSKFLQSIEHSSYTSSFETIKTLTNDQK